MNNHTSDAYFISKLEDATIIGGWHLKDRGVYCKVRGVIHMKFQNFVIFCFQITEDKYHYDI